MERGDMESGGDLVPLLLQKEKERKGCFGWELGKKEPKNYGIKWWFKKSPYCIDRSYLSCIVAPPCSKTKIVKKYFVISFCKVFEENLKHKLRKNSKKAEQNEGGQGC
jgi:hypothetical protein